MKGECQQSKGLSTGFGIALQTMYIRGPPDDVTTSRKALRASA
jgi:hypothetical protein